MRQKGFVHILVILILVVVAVGSVIFFSLFIKSEPKKGESPSSQEAVNINQVSASPLASNMPQQTPLKTPAGVNQSSSVQESITNLQNQINQLQQSPQPQNNSGKQTQFIPLGSSDPVGNTSWTPLSSVWVYLNPSNFPGFLSMQLEINLRLNSGGTAYAQLWNMTTQTPISGSTISTTSTVFSPLVSGTFTLSPGNNLYQIQVMSTSGDNMYIENARLRINY